MRALITGINGFVGGHLAELLLEHGWDVHGIALSSVPRLASLKNRVQVLAADLLEPLATRAAVSAIDPQVIFHLAAQAHVPTAHADPVGTISNNLLAQLHLFETLRALNLDPVVVVACTSDAYGSVRPEDIPVDEDTPLRPNNPYAMSKVAQDMLALQYHLSYGLRTVRLRLFNHIGPRQTDAYVAPSFAHQIARIEAGLQEPVIKVGNLDVGRDFTDVRDVVEAYRLAAVVGEPGAVYNIGTGEAVSIGDLLATLLELSTTTITVEPDPARMRPVDVPIIACDARRFQTQTGWQPRIPLPQSLEDILNDWRGRVRSGEANGDA
jgi:GDP-4-dehydro-6-deoxy-D-mannose reductase